ncbi:hypothetical protein CHH51_06860 [Terribacillus saccharophilus]|nr:hypothetical protein CHH51_06860 [Terribacillus saccharophilus]
MGGEKIGQWIQDGGIADAWQSIKDGASTASQFAQDTWSSFSSWFGTNVSDPVASGFNNSVDWIKEAWGTISTWFSDNVITPIVDAFNSSVTWIQDTWSTFSTWFDENIFTPIYNGAVNTINFVVGLFAYAWDGITAVWGFVSTWFMENVWTPVSEGVSTAASWIWTKLQEAWTWITETWITFSTWFEESVWLPIKNGVTTAATWIWSKLMEAWTWISETWLTVSTWFEENVWTPVKNAVMLAGLIIWTKLQEAWTFIQETWLTVSTWFTENVWNPVSNAVTTAATWIWTKLQEAWTWIQSIWTGVSTWFTDTVWTPMQTKTQEMRDDLESKFQGAKDKVTEIWSGLSGWFETNVKDPIVGVADSISSAFETAFGWVDNVWGKVKDFGGSVADGWNNITSAISGRGKEVTGLEQRKPDKNATGGYITKPTISWIGEAGNEFVIPTENNKGRGKMLLAQAANKLGMNVVDDMQQAAAGGSSTVTPITAAPSYSYQPTITPNADVEGMNQQSTVLGREFTTGFDTGIKENVVSMDAWKQKNVKTPMQQMVTYSPTYGKGVVNGFAVGQNATATNTGSYLNRHVRTPFMSAQAEAPSWGTGLMSHFISGMNDSGANVTQAAKDLAERVDKAFREELDIHSPSRRMRANGQFAAIGIIKGLDDVDIENFAKSKASSLAAAFSNMNGVGGDISAWLATALMATNTPMSWLGPLSMMAQRESGGNPRAINNWDINAKRGTPSKGLMQTIDPTFQAYKGKGMNDIWNPVHNAVASINYIKARYGTVFNTPGMRNMARGGGYRGYANGGLITNEQIARIGEGGKREWIIPEERGIRGHYLLNQAAQSMGYQLYDEGETQIDPGQSAAAIGGTTKTVYVEKQGTVVEVNFNGENNYYNNTDVEAVAAAVKQAIVDELEEEIRTGSEGVPDE